MNTYLLAWNPNRWKWIELSQEADQIAAGKIVTGRWSCGNTKKNQRGDRVFLIRLGVEPKGIMGSGWVSEPPKLTTHWNDEKAKAGEKNLLIICEWERIINPERDSHLKPLGNRESPSETSLDDLAIVCANCHAMIHRGGKCRALNELIP